MKPCPNIWADGRITQLDNFMTSPFHQGLNYGACIYEGIRYYKTDQGPAIFRLQEHLARFFYSAKTLRMNLPYTPKVLEKAIHEVVRVNGLDSGYLRPLAYYSEIKMGINIFDSTTSTLIFAWPWEERNTVKTAKLWVPSYKRLSPDSVDFKAKISGYYANGLLGFIEARDHGYDAPLFLDQAGYIAEGAVNNIFIVKSGKLYTPKIGNILAGITRDTIIVLAKDLGIEVIEENLSLDFLRDADEVFLTGTGIELESVAEVADYFKAGQERSLTQKIQNYYQQVAKGQIEKYNSYLTYLP